MHESGLIEDLIQKIEAVARQNSARKIVGVEVLIGALASIGADHLREHFQIAAAGTLAEGAELRVTVSDDLCDPNSTGVLLQSVEVET
jgi:hydrogenase nickel incorporation protein HypA/HybF